MPVITPSDSIDSSPTWPKWLLYTLGAAVLALAYYTLFRQLGSVPIPMYDEGRLAINAAEMEHNSNWLVTYYGGAPDLWNTKPPLMIWLQALSLRALGYSELALRLPSALAALATAALVFGFAYRYLRQQLGAFLAVLVLLTADGYIEIHVVRTGDYDALLTLWLTTLALSFYWYLESGRRRALACAVAALVLATLTKGVAGLFWLPALVIYAAWRQRLAWLLGRREVYVSIALAAALIASYYLAREHYNPGYWHAVSDNELGGRLLGTLDGHLHPWSWFVENLYDRKFVPWLLMLPFSLFLLSLQQNQPRLRNLAKLGGVCVMLHVALISTAKTKLLWYDAPIYPMASLLVGLSLGLLLTHIMQQQLASWAMGGLTFLFIVALFTYPVMHVITKLNNYYTLRYTDPNSQHGFLIRAMNRKAPQINKYTLFSDQNYDPPMTFYALGATRNYGYDVAIKLRSELPYMHVGELVLVCGEGEQALIQQRFKTIVVQRESTCAALYLQAAR